MKKIFARLIIIALPFSSVFAIPTQLSVEYDSAVRNNSHKLKSGLFKATEKVQQNLIGEVASIDRTTGKIVILTDAKASITVTVNDQTTYKRVRPGETSLTNAEQIKITDIQIGDRVLIPGGVSADPSPIRQIIVMSRGAINTQRQEELEKRRNRTISGRVTAINAEKREITFQTRSRAGAGFETLIVAAPENVKLLRYAQDSLKISDAVSGSLTDIRVGDQIRVVGDRNADGTRVNAEEILSGSITRSVGSVSEINQSRGEVVVKNNQTGELMTVTIGKNTILRRITPEVAQNLKQRFERIRERRNERTENNTNEQTQPNRRRNGDERRNQNNSEQTNRNPRQLFENLPVISVSQLKKGDAVLITGNNRSGNSNQLTAVSIISGDGELLQILQRTQGGRNGNSNMSPGLPGNVSGGNAGTIDDDEPER